MVPILYSSPAAQLNALDKNRDHLAILRKADVADSQKLLGG
jgi:hypothetical protein